MSFIPLLLGQKNLRAAYPRGVRIREILYLDESLLRNPNMHRKSTSRDKHGLLVRFANVPSIMDLLDGPRSVFGIRNKLSPSYFFHISADTLRPRLWYDLPILWEASPC